MTVYRKRVIVLVLALALVPALIVGFAFWHRPLPPIPENPAPAAAGFTNHGLVGMGRLPAAMRDKFGETSIAASGMAPDPKTWQRRDDGTYQGIIYLLPDRGWNISGTVDFRPRVHKFSVVFNPSAASSQQNVVATLIDTIMLTDAKGQPLTGLDPEGVRRAADGFPDLPQAPNGRISLDPEALVLLPDGSFFIGDEYGPYLYRFSATGQMLGAIRPPDALIPIRKGVQNFSSNNPGPGAHAPTPRDPDIGRQNNQGFEGLALTPDGRTLVAILQSATRQDGGNAFPTRQYTRMLFYDISNPAQPRLTRHLVVPLPTFTDAKGRRQVAAQSEMLAIDNERFLLLCRDASSGYGLKDAKSVFRQIELIDTRDATNLIGMAYEGVTPVAPGGKLVDGIKPATLATIVDLNDNAQLAKFGLHNGEPNDRNNLSEKWEAMALLPLLDPARPRDFFLFIANDNDFMTQNGFQVGTAYKDASGVDVDTMFLVFHLTVPELGK